MIKNDKVEIFTKGCRKLKYFESLGYDINSDRILIKIEHLSVGSRELIDVICDYCGNEVRISYKEYYRNISTNGKYACCKYCGSLKAKETNKELFGVENPMQLKEYKDKLINTNLEKYGVEYPMMSEEIKNKSKETLLKNYGVDHISKSEYFKNKIKETFLIKYGVEYPMMSEEIKNKSKETLLKNYGVENPLKSIEIKEKVKQTNKKKYGKEYPQILEEIKHKTKQTNLERYGVENPMQSIEIKEKVKQTNLEKYGVESPMQSDIVKEKVKSTNLERYGVKNPMQSIEIKEKVKQTNLERYGVEYSFQSKEIKTKSIETCLERYGVENPMQSDIIKEKVKSTNLERYGVEYPQMLDEFKEKIKQTCLKKYGVDNPFKCELIRSEILLKNILKYGVEYPQMLDEFKERVKNTNIERYGVEYPQMLDEFKEKRKQTCLNKYDVEYPQMLNKFKDKVKQTCLERYGVDNAYKIDFVKDKIKLTNIERYGNETYIKSDDFKEKSHKSIIKKYGSNGLFSNEKFRKNNFNIDNNVLYVKYLGKSISRFKCDCGKDHSFDIHIDNYYRRLESKIPLCTVCNPIGEQKSIKEKMLYEFICGIYDGKIISGYRDKLEIDIYLPELKLGFEFNGLYYHSSKFKDKNYHLDKKNYFSDKGIRIIHIWEDDWTFKPEIIKSQIRNFIGSSTIKFYARNCYVKEINSKESCNFLKNNHIQGQDKSKIKLGLFLENELISIMTFNKNEGRKKLDIDEWNLSRYCNILNTSVIGGAGKLLDYFVKKYSAKRIISYADNDWSNGNLYYKLGFIKEYVTKPDYKYIIDDVRKHKQNFKNIKNESAFMNLNNIFKIYDCGKIKFEKKYYI